MRSRLLKTVRGYRTWPKFAGAACLALAVAFADGYFGVAVVAVYLLALAVLLRGLPARFVIAPAAVSFFIFITVAFSWLRGAVVFADVFLLPAKMVVFTWVSAYLYCITTPAALVGFFVSSARPLRFLGVSDVWAASLGFAVGSFSRVRSAASNATVAARLRGAPLAGRLRRVELAGLVVAKALTFAVNEAVSRADALLLRAGTARRWAVRREYGCFGFFLLASNMAVSLVSAAGLIC